MRTVVIVLAASALLFVGCGSGGSGNGNSDAASNDTAGFDQGGPPVEDLLNEADNVGIDELCSASIAAIDEVSTPKGTCGLIGVGIAAGMAAAPPEEGVDPPTTEQLIASCKEYVSKCEDEAPNSWADAEIDCDLKKEGALDDCTASVDEYSACTTSGAVALKAALDNVGDLKCDDLKDLAAVGQILEQAGQQAQPAECKTLEEKCPSLYEEEGGVEPTMPVSPPPSDG